MNKTLIIIFVLFLHTGKILGQLNQSINLSANKASISQCLNIIEKKGNINFSYNPQVLPKDSIVSINFKNTEISEILDSLLNNQYFYIEKGRIVIIKPKTEKNGKSGYVFHGRILNAINQVPLRNVKIETNNTEQNTVTNYNGYFSIYSLNPEISIKIKAEDYCDTIIQVRLPSEDLLVYLPPADKELEIIIKAPLLLSDHHNNPNDINHKFIKRLIPESQYNDGAIDIESTKKFQFSVFPGIGSDNMQSQKNRYNQSINLIGGYVGAVSGYEIGLGFNIIRYNMLGFQYGSLLNYVGGSVSGTQVSLGLNYVNRTVFGVQLAGINNFAQSLYGLQFSLGTNILTKRSRGLQIAGLSNISTDTLNGYQFAGIANISNGDFVTAQIAGIINYSQHHVKALQLASIANIARSNSGFQISGIYNSNENGRTLTQFASIINKTNTNAGVQLSGIYNKSIYNNGIQLALINKADTVSGIQIGLINVSNSNQGLAVGLLSVVKDGYRAIEFGYGDAIPIHINFKSGQRKLYNIINIGLLYSNNKPGLSLGYGLGTGFEFGSHFFFNTDLTASHVFEQNQFVDKLNLLTKLNIEIGVNIARKFIIYTGPSLNYMASKWANPYTGDFLSEIQGVPQLIMTQSINGDTRNTLWIGYSIGIRI